VSSEPGGRIAANVGFLFRCYSNPDKALAQLAGRLRAVTTDHGLSLGDRFCLALAQRDGLPVWTSDQSWKAVADAAKAKVVAIR